MIVDELMTHSRALSRAICDTLDENKIKALVKHYHKVTGFDPHIEIIAKYPHTDGPLLIGVKVVPKI